jgi:hypothetical protein
MPSGGRDLVVGIGKYYQRPHSVTRGLADTEPEACQEASDAARKGKLIEQPEYNAVANFV